MTTYTKAWIFYWDKGLKLPMLLKQKLAEEGYSEAYINNLECEEII